jgi:hypothetical protein
VEQTTERAAGKPKLKISSTRIRRVFFVDAANYSTNTYGKNLVKRYLIELDELNKNIHF